jgi:hypothetical protein
MRIKAQKVPLSTESPEDTLARFCYHFPQYTFAEARKLPYKRIRNMLKIARKEQARMMYELVQVIAAPHTNKGKGVGALSKYYRDLL